MGIQLNRTPAWITLNTLLEEFTFIRGTGTGGLLEWAALGEADYGTGLLQVTDETANTVVDLVACAPWRNVLWLIEPAS
jgi:hypothetical protein